MIINLFLVVFLLFMAYWWSTQGLFSALIHLLSVIVAGALAFALWEPITFGLFMKVGALAQYAWGLGLILPFIAWLAALRFAGDKLIGRNMYFAPLVSQIGGGVLGLLAAILTAGVTILGISFMHLSASFGGYQPLLVEATGTVAPNEGGGLWVGVDTMTVNFYNKLSAGAFSNATPLKTHQPDLAQQAALFRMKFDPNGSAVAPPDTVTAAAMYIQPTPIANLTGAQSGVLGAAATAEGNQLVVVDTKWTLKNKIAYDTDDTLRLSPTQIRLVTQTTAPDGSVESQLHAPISAATAPGPTAPRTLIHFADDATEAYGLNNEETIGFAFMIPTGEEPRFLLARHTRLALPQPVTEEPDTVIAALGTPSAPAADTGPPTDDPNLAGGVGSRSGHRTGSAAFDASVSNAIPRAFPVSAAPTTLNYNESSGEIIDGFGDIRPPEGRTGQKVLDQLQTPGHKAMVRIGLSRDRANSLLGAAVSAAASLAGPELTDANGNIYQPIGYVWQKASGYQEIKVDRTQLIRSSRQLPVREMGGEDTIYLYFLVNRGTSITQYAVGQTRQEMDLRVP